MSARRLRMEGDPVLREVSVPVEKWGAELDALVQDLFDTMYAERGRGLAAPQIGVNKRVFVIDTTWKDGKKSPIAFVNPKIVEAAPFQQMRPEACLSIPGRSFNMSRPVWVDLQWTSPAGIDQTARLVGIEALCACHEIDHLDGILITDNGVEV